MNIATRLVTDIVYQVIILGTKPSKHIDRISRHGHNRIGGLFLDKSWTHARKTGLYILSEHPNILHIPCQARPPLLQLRFDGRAESSIHVMVGIENTTKAIPFQAVVVLPYDEGGIARPYLESVEPEPVIPEAIAIEHGVVVLAIRVADDEDVPGWVPESVQLVGKGR